MAGTHVGGMQWSGGSGGSWETRSGGALMSAPCMQREGRASKQQEQKLGLLPPPTYRPTCAALLEPSPPTTNNMFMPHISSLSTM